MEGDQLGWLSNLESQTLSANNSVSDDSGDKWVRLVGMAVGIFDICVGSIGNLLTIIAILGNRKLRGTFHIFIVNLCFVDFATATFMMPLNVASYAQGSWPFGNEHITCAIQAYFYYCCGYSSVVCLVVITINRYIGVLFPRKYEDIFVTKVVIAITTISFLFAPAVMSVVFFIGDEPGVPGYGWFPKYSLCVFKASGDNDLHRQYMLATRVLFQGVPLIIMVVMYSHIFYSARKSGRTVTKMSLKSAESEVGVHSLAVSDVEHPDLITISRPNYSNRTTPNLTPISARRNNLVVSDHPEVSSLASVEDVRRILRRTVSVPSMTNRSVVSFENGGSGTRTPESSRQVLGPLHKVTLKAMVTNGSTSTVNNLQKKSEKTTKYATSLHETIRKRQKMDRKLLLISLTICLVFSLMFYPSVIINLLPGSRNFNPNVHRCASIITWFNSCVNPIIYFIMNPKLRKHYKNIFNSIRRRCCHVDTADGAQQK